MPPSLSLRSSSASARTTSLFPPAFLAPSLYLSTRSGTPDATKINGNCHFRNQHQYQQTRAMRSVVNRRFLPKLQRLSRFNALPSLPVLSASPKAASQRRRPHMPLRTGALAVKKGMTVLYDATTGVRQPCTVLQLDRVQVVGHKTQAEHGYYAVQVGAGSRTPKNVGRPMLGHFAKMGVPVKERVVEFRVPSAEGLLPVGKSITANWFRVGDFVDARSRTRGHGFAGGMKKHGWSGQPASHGQSLTHRVMGSSGGGQGSGSRVPPGKKMPGRMGNEQNTIMNLKVCKVDEENGLVLVGGCVSGPKGCYVKISDAMKKPWPDVPSLGHTALAATATAPA